MYFFHLVEYMHEVSRDRTSSLLQFLRYNSSPTKSWPSI